MAGEGAKLATAYYELIAATPGAERQITQGIMPGAQAAGDKAGASLGERLVGGLKAMAGPVAAVLAGFSIGKVISDGVQAFADLNGEVKSLQRIIGGSVAEVSGLRGAMQLSGMDTDKATTSMTIFSRKLEDASGDSEKLAALQSKLGTSVTNADGSLRSMNDLLPEVANRFKGMPDGPEKTALAVQLFGRSGTAMLPFLNQGAEGIANLTSKANGLGLVLDDASQKKWADYRGALRGVSTMMQGLSVQIGSAFIPLFTSAARMVSNALTPAIQGLISFLQSNTGLQTFISGLASGMEKLGTAIGSGLGGASGVLGSVTAALAPLSGALAGTLVPLITKIPLLGSSLGMLGGPVGMLVASLGGLIATSPQMREAFGAALQPVLASLGTAMSTLGPVISQVATSLGGTLTAAVTQLAPFLGQLVGSLGGVVAQLLGSLVPAVAGLLTTLLPVFTELLSGGVVPLVTALVGSLVPVLVDVVNAALPVVTTLVGQLAPAFGTILGALLPVATSLMSTLAPAITSLVSAVAPVVTTLLGALMPALSSILGVISPLITTVAGFAGQLLTALVPVLGLVGPLLEPIIQIVSALLPILTPILGLITPILNLLMAVLQPILDVVLALLTPLLELASGVLSAVLVPILQLLAGVLSTVVVPVLDFLVTVISTVVTWIADFITALVGLVTGNADAGAQMQALWQPIGDFFTGLWNGFLAGLGAVGDFLFGWVPGFASAVSDGWNQLWGGVGSFLSDAWSNITATVSAGVDSVIAWFTGLPDQIMSALAGAGQWLVDVGTNIVQGLIDGISSMISGIGDTLTDGIEGAIGGVKDLLGIHSPSRVFRVIGQMTGEGMRLGVQDGEAGVSRAMQSLVTPPRLPAFAADGYAPTAVAASTPSIQQNVYPSEGMSEETFARSAYELLAFERRRFAS